MEKIYDVIVVGGGPAGLTAALYLARAKCSVLVLEPGVYGGQIAITEEVVNYPGLESVPGQTLGQTIQRQAESFGAEFLAARAEGYQLEGKVKTVRTSRGDYHCLGLLLATGAHPRTVGFQGEETFRGRGVSYCATCDGAFFTGKEVFVIGGGYAAAEEGVFLTKFAKHVTILLRKPDFSCPKSLADKAKTHEKITVLPNTVVESVTGQRGITAIRYKNTATGEVTEYPAEAGETLGIFVFAGYAPSTEGLEGLIKRDAQGYLETDEILQTSVPGVYAAGDVRVKSLRQVVTATADGALAAAALEKYVVNRRGVSNSPGKAAAAPQEKQPVLTGTMRTQLKELLSGLESPLLLRLTLDDTHLSRELEGLCRELTQLSDKLTVASSPGEDGPCVSLCREDGTETGLAFHGCPVGQEFTPFVLGIYNAAGPGQPLEEGIRLRIRNIQEQMELEILVTPSCTLCPDTVIAAQRIAAQSEMVTCHVYDVTHFPALREQYQIMSVPCIVKDHQVLSFGRKTMEQLLDLLEV